MVAEKNGVAVDFEEIFNNMNNITNIAHKDNLQIIAGEVGEKENGDNSFFELIDTMNKREFKYLLLEKTNEIKFMDYTTELGQSSVSKINLWLLERLRLFNEKFDLSIWRKGREDKFAWLLIAEGEKCAADAENLMETLKQFKAKDYWQRGEEYTKEKLYIRRGSALLWGKKHKEGNEVFWHDDRVAAANLSYPIVNCSSSGRVEIEYTAYSQKGAVQFVRYQKLREYQEK